MTTTDLRGVYLTEKDLEFLRYLHAVKVSTYDRIHRDIYSGYKITSAGNRIRKIHDNGLIEVTHGRLILGGKRLVSLSQKGYNLYLRTGDELRIELKSDSILHDLELNDIRSSMIHCADVVEYKTENQIQTWNDDFRSINSDALVTISRNGEAFQMPLEYERSHKKASRYNDLVHRYYGDDGISAMLYIAKDYSIMNKVMDIERKLYPWEHPKIFYCYIEDFLKDHHKRFQNFNGSSLII